MRSLAPLALALALAVASCSGDDDRPEENPEDALAEAKATLDETTGVRLGLSTENLPSQVTGLTSATGVAVRPPAFQGDLELSVNGLPARVQVISVDGTTYAKNALLLPTWTAVEPADYGAPDPAAMIAPDSGISALLEATTRVEEGESVRGGADNTEVLTEYSGVVPGEAVASLIPSASGDFDVTYEITEDAELRRAVITGAFYQGADELTYTLTLDDYGLEQEITAPKTAS